MLNIRGFIPSSFIEISGYACFVIFLGGCNFRCPYCQNKDLVLNYEKLPLYPETKILKLIEERKNWIDYVVITGGEPTLDPELPYFLEKIKNMGIKTAIETNGSLPEVLYYLLKEELVDYVAMDIKTSPKKYKFAIGVDYNIEKILQSIKLVMKLAKDYEFRITVVPKIVEKEDIIEIGNLIKGAKLVCLQQFHNENGTLDPNFEKIKPYERSVIEEFANILQRYVKKVKIKNI